MEKLKKNWPTALLLLVIAGCMFILNISTLISPDDYSYAMVLGGSDLKVTSFSEITKAAKYLYVSWTGRILPHILVGLFMTTSIRLFKVLNTILFLVLLLIITRFITRKNTYLSVITAFGFFVYGTMFGEKFAWISRKSKLFMDSSVINALFILFLWIFCRKYITKKMAENNISNSRFISWIFT